MKNLPESLKSDTGCISRHHLSVCTGAEEKHQQIKTLEDVKQDAEEQHPMKDTFEEITLTQSEQLHTLPTSTDEIRMSTKKVGCILLTIDIYHMLSLLDKYL